MRAMVGHTPVISVLMTVYNGGRYLLEAVESILGQSFGDFEFLILDDGSSDYTPQILRSLRDPRIVTYRNDLNLGIPKSLNRILSLARGRYVTRMDSDDISVANRFAGQVEFLNAHPEIGLSGSACVAIGPEGSEVGLRTKPTSDLAIRWHMLLDNPFVQSSVMFRHHLIDGEVGGYDEGFPASQDYDLWARILERTRAHNSPEPLIKYRIHDVGITGKRRHEQLRNHDVIVFRVTQRTLPEFHVTFEEMSELRRFLVARAPGEDEVRIDPVALVGRYASLLTAFVARYSKEPGIEGLRRTEALKIARLLMRHRAGFRWLTVAARLLALEPALIKDAARRGVGRVLSGPAAGCRAG